MFKGGGRSQGDLNGFLDAGSAMTGELQFEDTFRIDGKFSGSIDAQGDLIVGEGGEVDAQVRARQVFVSGTARGTIHATDRLEITSTGRVLADLTTPSLCVEDGAFFEGRCSMERSKVAGDLRPAPSPGPSKVTPMPLAKKQR